MAVAIKMAYEFQDLIENCWGEALETLNTIAEHENNTDLMALLEELEFESLTDLNNFLASDKTYIYKCLGITKEQ